MDPEVPPKPPVQNMSSHKVSRDKEGEDRGNAQLMSAQIQTYCRQEPFQDTANDTPLCFQTGF